jgi:hypothetical protein
MWLGSRGHKMGFTADAHFIKPYMRAVSDQLSQLYPSMQTQKV